ncbi:unnamed protein product [Rhizopus stolonifer]
MQSFREAYLDVLEKKNDAPLLEESAEPTESVGFELEENDDIIYECWKEGAGEDIKICKRHTEMADLQSSNEVRENEIDELRSHRVFDNDVIVEIEGLDLVEHEDDDVSVIKNEESIR